MKVVQISRYDTGGAGLCCYRIMKSLQDVGVECKMLVSRRSINDASIYSYRSIRYVLSKLWSKVFPKFSEEIKVAMDVKQYREDWAMYSLPVAPTRLDKHPLVKDADVVHIHWANTFLDYPSFFSKSEKPIVMTLHDENLFYGIAHYENACLPECESEKKYYNIKLESIRSAKNLGIVFLSKMMYDKYKDHEMIKHAKKTVINNSVDCNIFKRHNKSECRHKLGISQNDIVFVFVANGIMDPRKGLLKALEALEKLNLPNSKILAVGPNGSNFKHEKLISIGSITDPDELSKAYSAADYFILPSSQEAFAQTPIEAMACGVPAIVFPVSGTEELINRNNGIRCHDFTVTSLIDAIKEAMTNEYDSNVIIDDVKNRFSPQVIANYYVSFYKEVLNHSPFQES